MSEWGARDAARHLSLEIQLDNISSSVSPICPSRSSSSRPRMFRPDRRVGFDDYVSVVWLPMETSSTKGVIQCRVPTSTTVDDLVRDLTPALPGGAPPDDAPADVPPLPQFVQHILTGVQLPVDDDWDQGMTIRTWFLHHEHHLRCDHPRLLQMVGDANSWRPQVLALWLDRIRQGEPIQIFAVDPDPPRPGSVAHVAHDLIVVQGHHEQQAAGLVTAVLCDEPSQYFAAAALLPFHVHGLQLADVVRLTNLCQQHQCRAFHRETEIPMIATPTFLMENGRSFVVNLHLTSTAASSDSLHNDEFPLQVHVPAPPVLHIPDDEVSDGDDETASEGMSVDDSPHEQPGTVDLNNMQSVTVYGLHRDPVHLYLRWRQYTEVIVDMANRLRIPIDQIVTYHAVPVHVAGQTAAEANVILQRADDLPIGVYDQLILLDLEVHQHPAPRMLPAAPHVARKVCRVVQHVIRQHLLMHAGVLEYCHTQHQRCLVFVNGHLWPLQDLAARMLVHGDYVRIVVPPPSQTLDGTLQTIDLTERQHRVDLPPNVQPFQFPAQVPPERHAHAAFGPAPADDLPCDIPAAICHSQDPAPALFGPPPRNDATSQQVTLHVCDQKWMLPAKMLYRQQALVASDDDVPEVEWVTWFLSAPLRLRSEESRTARLGPDRARWLSQLYELWRDQWLGYLDIQILVVSPEPARAEHQTHVGHLLLVQGDIPQQVPVLVTMLFQSQLGHRLAHLAAFIPEFFDIPTMLQLLRLERVCQTRGCFITLDGQRVPDHGLGFAEAGDNVQLTAPPRQTDHSALLQVDLRLTQPSPLLVRVRRQQDLDEIRLEYACDRPLFGPDARHIPVPMIGGIEGDLLTLWPHFWQHGAGGAEPFMKVTTWFNDHALWPICDAPRDVVLSQDVAQWQQLLRQPWLGRLDPVLPIEYILVAPSPREIDPQVAAHVILLQRPYPDAASIMVSVSDNLVLNGQPRRWVLRSSRDPTGLELVALMGYRQLCPPEDTTAYCHLRFRRQTIDLYERVLVRHGVAFVLEVHRLGNAPHPDHEDLSFLQLPSARGDERLTDDSVAHVHRPSHPPEDDATSHMQSCMSPALSHSPDVSHEDDVPLSVSFRHPDDHDICSSACIGTLAIVWFIDGISLPHNPAHRFVTLSGDSITWAQQLRSVWHDHLQVEDVISVTMVESLPGGLQEAAQLGFILHRNLASDQRALLLTLYDNGLGDGRPFSFARAVVNDVTRITLLTATCRATFVRC